MKSNHNYSQQRLMARIVQVTGAALLSLVPSVASAHDNLGGDELAVANWMLIGALVTVVIGIFWGVWALKSGQFSNIESSKYTMLENAEDYDAIMAEFDAQQEAARAGAALPALSGKVAPQADPTLAARPAVRS